MEREVKAGQVWTDDDLRGNADSIDTITVKSVGGGFAVATTKGDGVYAADVELSYGLHEFEEGHMTLVQDVMTREVGQTWCYKNRVWCVIEVLGEDRQDESIHPGRDKCRVIPPTQHHVWPIGGFVYWMPSDYEGREDFERVPGPLEEIGAKAVERSTIMGWHKPDGPKKDPLIDHALIVSEVAEMTEACRRDTAPSEHIPEFTAEEEEAADVIVRLCGYAVRRGLRLDAAVAAKMKFNATREPSHGGKRI